MTRKEHNPYKRISHEGKQKYEHRVIIEKSLGRKLSYNETIHHIDGNRKNNKIGNLKLINRNVHVGNHNKEKTEYIKIICNQCGKEFSMREKFYKFKRKKQKNFYCSRECVWLGLTLNSSCRKGKEYVNKIIKGMNEGLTGYQIAKKYNFNNATVYNHLRNLRDKSNKP